MLKYLTRGVVSLTLAGGKLQLLFVDEKLWGLIALHDAGPEVLRRKDIPGEDLKDYQIEKVSDFFRAVESAVVLTDGFVLSQALNDTIDV